MEIGTKILEAHRVYRNGKPVGIAVLIDSPKYHHRYFTFRSSPDVEFIDEFFSLPSKLVDEPVIAVYEGTDLKSVEFSAVRQAVLYLQACNQNLGIVCQKLDHMLDAMEIKRAEQTFPRNGDLVH